jgi:RHS repeat-associated protein
MGGVDQVVQRTDSSSVRSFLTDVLGSTLSLADSTGTVQTNYTFDPLGNTTEGGSANSNTFADTGPEIDTSNLLYYRARYYPPVLQRFISEHPKRADHVSRRVAEARGVPGHGHRLAWCFSDSLREPTE